MADFVVCINSRRWFNCRGRVHPNPPKKGNVYTVRASKEKPRGVFIQLAEYSNEWFSARAFRPLNNKRLDIFHKVDVPITEEN